MSVLYKWTVRLLKNSKFNSYWQSLKLHRGEEVGNYYRLSEYIRLYAPNKSFVDVGCMWGINGEFAFVAEEAGATVVKAVDIFGPTPEFEAKRKDLNSSIEFILGDASHSATGARIGVMDVVFCAGVLYHHPSPFDLLVALRRICGQTLILYTASIPEIKGLPNAAIYYPMLKPKDRRLWDLRSLGISNQIGISDEFERSKDYGNWFWGLTPSCIKSMLQTAGFEVKHQFPEPFAQCFICNAADIPFEHKTPTESEARMIGQVISSSASTRLRNVEQENKPSMLVKSNGETASSETQQSVAPSLQKLFCSMPFEWFGAFPWPEIGEAHLCCAGWLEKSVGNLRHQSIDEIWNGEQAQEIRRSILDGTFEYCNHSTCPHLQSLDGPVQKVEDVKDEHLREVIAKRLTVLPYGPRSLNFSYDRSCNLACPSCRTEIIVETAKKQTILKIQDKMRNEALKDAHHLYITGSGDPFGSPFFRKFLQTLKKEDVPNLKEIFLHTNGMLWTERMWNTISKDIQQFIKNTEISIDAASAETYSINRRGGNFEKLLENLEFISGLHKNGCLNSVKISMVVQENNFMEMPDFVCLGKRFSFDTVFFSRLVNWGTYSEEEFKKLAVHFPTHSRHTEFLDLLKNKIFDDPIVHLGNLSELRRNEQNLEIFYHE